MALRKAKTWHSIVIPGCFSTRRHYLSPGPNPKSPQAISKQNSSLRLSLSDVSNPGSPISFSEISNSILNLHIFTLKELEIVTQKFSKSSFLGEGGFGKVYKGFIDDELRPELKAQPVAVKVLDLDGSQGHREWLAEVIFLGQLKHPHLVNLIGYCCEGEHRLLVYEYLERGNLDKQLFSGYSATLPWLTRLKIAVGAAKGLSCLHEEQKPVIYRDFKASNILLDTEYNAKLSDFGLAIDGPEEDKSHVTTCVMGTVGYTAPEYMKTGHLTAMSDVFGFGVVLLELLTGRRSIDKHRPSRQVSLVKWARPLLKDSNKLDQIMDPRLEGQYSAEGAKKAAKLAYQCLSHNPKSRPTMTTVVKALESLLQLRDIPIGPFVYVVPATELEEKKIILRDGKMENEARSRGEEPDINGEKIEGEEVRDRHQKMHRRNKRLAKLLRSRVHSDTALFRTNSFRY